MLTCFILQLDRQHNSCPVGCSESSDELQAAGGANQQVDDRAGGAGAHVPHAGHPGQRLGHAPCQQRREGWFIVPHAGHPGQRLGHAPCQQRREGWYVPLAGHPGQRLGHAPCQQRREGWYVSRAGHPGQRLGHPPCQQGREGWYVPLAGRVASGLEKSGKFDIFSRSGNCPGILKISQ